MATSGSDTYALTRDLAITMALRKLNVLELGVTPDATTISQANNNLNIMLKAWQTDGLKIWTVQEQLFQPVANQTSYVIGPTMTGTITPDLVAPKPIKLLQAWIRNVQATPNIDTPLTIVTQQDYNFLGSKFSTGTTNTVYLYTGEFTSTLYLYPTPDASTVTNYYVHLIYQRQIQDMINSTDNFDLPQEWSQAIIWNLALELSEEYDVPADKIARITARADKYKMQLEDWDTEHGSTFFQPDYRMQYQRGL